MSEPHRGAIGFKLFAEFAVIVIGVLVALGVDGMVENRAEDVRRTEMLIMLRSDLRESVADLRRDSDQTKNQVAALEWLLSFPIDGSEAFPEDSFVSIGRAANITSSYSPILRTYEAMVSTGSMGLLDNTEIEFGLAKLQKSAAQYLDFRRQATDGWVLSLRSTWLRFVGGETESGGGPLPRPDMIAVMNNREFRGLVDHRRTFLMFVGIFGDGLAGQMDAILDLVDAELALRGVM